MITAHFTWQQAATWFYVDETGGNKEAEALFAKFGLKRIHRGQSETEVELMSNKRLDKPTDFKGLTFRGAGYMPLILQEPEFGANGVILATADVYTSLQTKIIDACEVGNAFGNWGSGYHEVTKYWYFPGIHKITETSSTIVNMDSWNKLPQDLQLIWQMAATHSMLRSWAFSHYKSAEIIPVLEQKHGIIIIKQTPEVQTQWKTIGWRIADRFAAADPLFKEMWERHKAFMKFMGPYEDLQSINFTTK
jgi:TRAP-type mannitol/chloroaromatic compound transport system substrate-binding protein